MSDSGRRPRERTPSSTTIERALSQGGLPRNEALILLAQALGRDRAWLLAHAGDWLGPDAAARFDRLCEARRAGEPVAYLVGRRAFWTLDLEVSPAVLIPRPETELLVERALAAIDARRARAGARAAVRVLDAGTGSGAIALAVAGERPDAFVVATDVEAGALAIAARNASRLGTRNVAFVRASWLDAFAPASFDVVVANPPYIAVDDPHLREGDLRFEPKCALTPGDDGLGALRRIVGRAPQVLADGGTLLVEHGFDQGAAVRALCEDASLGAVETATDLAGHERVTIASRR